MSKRHFYSKFSEEVPKDFERLYNKIVRHEEYSYDKDTMSKAIFFGDEEELSAYNIAEYITNQEKEEKEHTTHCTRMAALHNALESLKENYPSEYELIQLYYFSDGKITQGEIGKRRSISKQAVHKTLKKAYKHLREYINIDKNQD